MNGASLLIAKGGIIDGFASSNLFKEEVYPFITFIIFGILIFKRQINDPDYVIKINPGISIASGLVNAFSYLALIISFNFIDVSLAEPISALNVFLAMIFVRILFKEDIK